MLIFLVFEDGVAANDFYTQFPLGLGVHLTQLGFNYLDPNTDTCEVSRSRCEYSWDPT